MRTRIIKMCILVLVLVSILVAPVTLKASAPYVTQTVNRYGEIVETQDAYEPIKSVKTLDINGVNTPSFTGAQDLFIDSEDYLYLADTERKQVVVMDKEFNYLASFGSDKLIRPLGIFVRDEYVYVADYGDDNDAGSGQIVVYTYDKTTNTATYDKTFKTPDSNLLKVEGFIFRPEKIAVDANHTMYIVSKGSSNGVLLVNSKNRFLNYFAPNETPGTFWDQVVYFLYGNNENVLLDKKIPDPPTNVMLDDSGYIYTVTSSATVQNDLGDTLKKVNIGGLNFYPDDMLVSGEFVDSWSSDYKTVYALTNNGFIYEYDIEGTLLFKFAGPIGNDEQLGLFKSASSIACDSDGKLYVVDPNSGSVQVFRKTNFTIKVHNALVLYMSGKYVESKELWEEVLRYNSMFDLAHKAIGLAYYLEHDYDKAMEKFEIAYSKEDYSEAFWEARNLWIMDNLTTVFGIVVAAILVIVIIKKTNKKFAYLDPIKNKLHSWSQIPWVEGILVMTKFIKKPLDAVYDVRHNKNVKWYNGLILLVLVFVVYILHITCTGFLFNEIVLEKTILLKETLKILLPIILFVVANYLVSSLMSGEGTFRNIFINTMGSLLPVVIMLPFIVLVSNVLTFNESFIYTFSMGVMLIWTAVLLFVVIKETHNYTAKQTFVNFIITIFMMLIIVIVLILLYLIVAQVAGFIVDLVKEAMF